MANAGAWPSGRLVGWLASCLAAAASACWLALAQV
jgi:hypothetical protein